MNARVHPFPRRHDQPLTLQQFMGTLSLIEQTMDWLIKNNVSIVAFGCNRRGPTINVAAHPAAYMLAKGSAERLSYRQVGLLRHEVWAFVARGGVEIAWEEVVCAP